MTNVFHLLMKMYLTTIPTLGGTTDFGDAEDCSVGREQQDAGSSRLACGGAQARI